MDLEKKRNTAKARNPTPPSIPVGNGPIRVDGFPLASNNANPAVPLIMACPMTAGHTVLDLSVTHARKIPKRVVNRIIMMIPAHGNKGYLNP